MSNQNYIIEMLDLKDSNVYFKENFYYKETIKGIIPKFLKVIFLMSQIFVLNVVCFLMINLKSMVLLSLIL